MSTLERLAAIIRDVLDADDFQVTRETVAADHEEWDSLAQINIISAMEKEFGVKFRLAEVQGLTCVGETVDLIDSKKGSQPA